MAHKAHLKGRKKVKSATGGVKQALREKAQKKAEKKRQRDKQKAKAALAGGAPSPSPVVPQPVQAAAPEAGSGAAKLTKKQARLLANLERQHRSLYTPGERILLVGEGNFSFARALCNYLEADGSGGVYATAFDGEAALNKKYPDAAEIRREIEETFGGTTLVGVDAALLHSVKEFRGAFNKIVWNFPHLGSGEKDVEKNIEHHRKLLAEFFRSAERCLDPESKDATIHVALKEGEPYKSWKVVQLAQATSNLEFRTAVAFAVSAWPGYAHRRTQGFDERHSKADSEELAKGAKIYVFGRAKP